MQAPPFNKMSKQKVQPPAFTIRQNAQLTQNGVGGSITPSTITTGSSGQLLGIGGGSLGGSVTTTTGYSQLSSSGGWVFAGDAYATVSVVLIFPATEHSSAEKVVCRAGKPPCVGDLIKSINNHGAPSSDIVYCVTSVTWVIDRGSVFSTELNKVEVQLKELDGDISGHNKLRKELIIKKVLEALL